MFRPHDSNDPYHSYELWNNGLRVVQVVNCISLVRKRESPNTLNTTYNRRSKNVRVQILKTQYIFFVLKTWEPKHANTEHNIYSSFYKRESPSTLNTESNHVEHKVYFFVLKTWEPKHPHMENRFPENTMYILRSKNEGAQTRSTQCVFLVLDTMHKGDFFFSKNIA